MSPAVFANIPVFGRSRLETWFDRDCRWRVAVGKSEGVAPDHESGEDKVFQDEVLNAARALGAAIELARTGHLEDPGKGFKDPQPK